MSFYYDGAFYDQSGKQNYPVENYETIKQNFLEIIKLAKEGTYAETQITTERVPEDQTGGNELVLGTLNILGEAENPIEFEPFHKVEGSISEGLEGSFKGITFENIKDNLVGLDNLNDLDSYFLTEGGAEIATEVNTLPNMTNYFEQKVSDYKTIIKNEEKKEKAAAAAAAEEEEKVEVEVDEEETMSEPTLYDLFIKKIIDLGEDNKWNPLEGRLNPLVFALNEFNGIYQKDYFKPETTTVGEPATVKKSDEYKIALINAYLEKLEEKKKDVKKLNSYLDLFFWDLFCFEFLKKNYEGHLEMCKKSYLFKDNGDVEKKEDLFEKLLAPLDEIEGNKNVIIGCQELPDSGDFSYLINDFKIERHKKSTGFIMSKDIIFENITEEAQKIFDEFPEYKGLEGKTGLSEEKEKLLGAFNTTKIKMHVGKFKLKNKKEVIVANFHCKSFKKNSGVQGELIKYILDELKNIDKKKKFEVFVVGDMNIEPQKKYDNEDKFKEEYEGKDEKLISEGKLPEENKNLNKFNEGLTGYTIFPEIENNIGTITTLKQRTLFQGQPNKAKHLVATQKDVVILPDTYEGVKLTFGGRVNEVGDIMKLLQPSKEWPGDHYAIFTEFTLN